NLFMDREKEESQIYIAIEEYFKRTEKWTLLNFLYYRKDCNDFTYLKRREHRLYKSSLALISDILAEHCLSNFE
ncbi:9045_t:CDS:1, partial [Racocetra fulgida]